MWLIWKLRLTRLRSLGNCRHDDNQKRMSSRKHHLLSNQNLKKMKMASSDSSPTRAKKLLTDWRVNRRQSPPPFSSVYYVVSILRTTPASNDGLSLTHSLSLATIALNRRSSNESKPTTNGNCMHGARTQVLLLPVRLRFYVVLAHTQKKHTRREWVWGWWASSLSLLMAIRVGLNREHGGLNMTAPARW